MRRTKDIPEFNLRQGIPEIRRLIENSLKTILEIGWSYL